MVPYPDFKLGRYLGPSIDVGLAMTAKILKEMVRSYIDPHIKH